MRLRRWAVSETGEEVAKFWTRRGAVKEYWARAAFTGRAERMGLYRFDGSNWRKQAYTLVDMGRGKMWLDEPTAR